MVCLAATGKCPSDDAIHYDEVTRAYAVSGLRQRYCHGGNGSGSAVDARQISRRGRLSGSPLLYRRGEPYNGSCRRRIFIRLGAGAAGSGKVYTNLRVRSHGDGVERQSGSASAPELLG